MNRTEALKVILKYLNKAIFDEALDSGKIYPNVTKESVDLIHAKRYLLENLK